jgi:hypothetical protein
MLKPEVVTESKIINNSAYWGEKYNSEHDTLEVSFYDRDNKRLQKFALDESDFERTYDKNYTFDGTYLVEAARQKLTEMLDPKGKGQIKIQKIKTILRADSPGECWITLSGARLVCHCDYKDYVTNQELTQGIIIDYIMNNQDKVKCSMDQSFKAADTIDFSSLKDAEFIIKTFNNDDCDQD